MKLTVRTKLVHRERDNTYYHTKTVGDRVYIKYAHVPLLTPSLGVSVLAKLRLDKNVFALPGHSMYVCIDEVYRVMKSLNNIEAMAFLDSVKTERLAKE